LQHYITEDLNPSLNNNYYIIKDERNNSAKDAGFLCWDESNFGFIRQGIVLDIREIKDILVK